MLWSQLNPLASLRAELLLLPTPLARWLRYAEARISTSHDYDGEKAKVCLALMPDFLGDAIDLYQAMSGETWR